MNGQREQRVLDERGWLEREVLFVLADHVGRENAIGMGELFEAVFEKRWEHRINDTRMLRIIVTRLRRSGTPICSDSSPESGGYWLAAAGSELSDYCKNLRASALKQLAMEAKLRKTTLPELVGQVQLELEGTEAIS